MARCPRCNAFVDRVAFPRWLRPLRIVLPGLKRMRCANCGWRGFRR